MTERFKELEHKRVTKGLTFEEWKERKKLYLLIHNNVNKKEQN